MEVIMKIKLKLEELQEKESNYIKSGKFIKARLIGLFTSFKISFLPSLFIVLIGAILRIILYLVEHRNIPNRINVYLNFILTISISFLLIYYCISFIIYIPKIVSHKDFYYIKSLIKIDTVLNLYSKNRKIGTFFKRMIGCSLIYFLIIFPLLLGIYLMVYLFTRKTPPSGIFEVCSIILIAILIFVSIYTMPEKDDIEKFNKHHAKFILWLFAFGFSIYNICIKFISNIKADGFEIIFYSITIIISMERMYNSYKKLEELYDEQIKTTNQLTTTK
jgi:hypothetical protein